MDIGRSTYDRVAPASTASLLPSASAIEEEILELTRGLSQGQFHAPTRNGGWSIGHCLEHLLLTGQAMLAGWGSPLQAAQFVEFRPAWPQRALLKAFANPSLFRRKAAPALLPCSRHSIEETVRRIHVMHQGFAEKLETAGGAGRISVPNIPWLRFSPGFAVELSLAHERRHLSQAWRVKREMGMA